MKSICILHFGKKGAGPAYSLEMARALCRLGYTIYYYASNEVENKKLVEKEPFEIRFFKTYSSKFSYLLSILFKINIHKVLSSIYSDSPDVVYSPMNDLWAPFIFPKLRFTLRIKTIHDVGVHEGDDSLFNKWWNQSNFHDADKYIILSKKYISKLVERDIPAEQILVMPHAGFDYYLNVGSGKDAHVNGKRILFFGRIDQYKGLGVLLNAMPFIIEKHPDVILSIVGNGNIGEYKDMILMYKNNIDLHNRWIKDEEVADFVSSCDFVVLPYTHATQSGVIPLAYSFSKPVVATMVGCLDEQVLDGKTGLLCEGNNIVDLATKIIQLLDNPQKTKELGQNAYEYMMQYLTWDSSAKLFSGFIS